VILWFNSSAYVILANIPVVLTAALTTEEDLLGADEEVETLVLLLVEAFLVKLF